MGQSVICSCGQRNKLDSYAYGEPRFCLACGLPLSIPPLAFPAQPGTDLTEEGFTPRVTGFEEDVTEANGAPTTGFETPTGETAPPEPEPPPRAWQGHVREAPAGLPEDQRCATCRRPFRGEWDRHASPDGDRCHICATQADLTYKPPDIQTRRELYRPVPPPKLAPKSAETDNEARQKEQKKKRELIILGAAAALTLLIVNVLPVEVWAAMLFASDLSQAETLSPAWNWVLRISGFTVSVIAHMLALHVALSLTQLLHEGGLRENFLSLLYLGIVFTLLNMFVSFARNYFGMVFGPVAGILIGMALILTLMIQLMMVAGQFHLRLEGLFGFFFSWVLASLLMKPCVFALHKLLQGVIAAIAL